MRKFFLAAGALLLISIIAFGIYVIGNILNKQSIGDDKTADDVVQTTGSGEPAGSEGFIIADN